MTIHTINGPRRDGKYLVSVSFDPGKNAFGGLNYAKVFKKLVTAERLAELKAKAKESQP